MRTALYYDPLYLQHDTGNHPENAGRLEAIVRAVESDEALAGIERAGPRPATPEELALVHDPAYVRQVQEAAESGRPYLNTPDCAMSQATYRAALHAAGAVAEGVRRVLAGELDNAFVACRPPGHHAERAEALGFCFFNNIAIGAAVLTQELGLERVLIFDFDVHHGNGTQHTFETRRDVFFASIHQHPLTCYPGTGFAEEKGREAGTGYTLNAPMQPSSDDDDYIDIFDRLLLPRFREFAPQFVLISAGFDAHREDPLAQIELTRRGFDHMLSGMLGLAAECCERRLVSVLEGGYHQPRLAECVASHLRLLHGSAA